MNSLLRDYNLDKLTSAEMVRIADALLTAAADDPNAFPLTETEWAEVERRIEAHRRDPSTAIPWEAIRAEAEQRIRR